MSAIKGFDSLPLRFELLNRLETMGFDVMTPVQAETLPAMLQGQDVLAQANTGSGKTAAYGLTCLQRLDPKAFHVQSLILCPTRELAEKVTQSLRNLAREIGNTKILTICGGMPLGPQIASLEHSAHLVVGTPGRVLKHLQKKTLHLSGLDILVFDEADRMLDMGFADEIDAILGYVPRPRQTLLFSATFPEGVKAIKKKLGTEMVRFDVTDSSVPREIEQLWCAVDESDRHQTLVDVIDHYGGALNLVFCNTKVGCAEVVEVLASHNIVVAALHGDMEQKERNTTIIRFSNGSINVLVATDVAARGLDIEDVETVVNFSLPHQPEVYVHRVGRTGRKGKNGRAISLVGDRERNRLLEVQDLIDDQISYCHLPESGTATTKLTPVYSTIEINGGRKHKLRPGDILGALTAKDSIKGDSVGKIDLMDRSAYVAIEQSKARAAIENINNSKIKGKVFGARILR